MGEQALAWQINPIGRAESLLRLPRSRSLIGYVALLEGAPDVG